MTQAADREAYELGVRALLAAASTPIALHDDLVVGIRTRGACVRLLARFRREAGMLVDRGVALRPPAADADVHRDVVRAARSALAALDRVVADVTRGTVGCGPALARRLDAITQAERGLAGLAELERRGYRLGLR